MDSYSTVTTIIIFKIIFFVFLCLFEFANSKEVLKYAFNDIQFNSRNKSTSQWTNIIIVLPLGLSAYKYFCQKKRNLNKSVI